MVEAGRWLAGTARGRQVVVAAAEAAEAASGSRSEGTTAVPIVTVAALPRLPLPRRHIVGLRREAASYPVTPARDGGNAPRQAFRRRFRDMSESGGREAPPLRRASLRWGGGRGKAGGEGEGLCGGRCCYWQRKVLL